MFVSTSITFLNVPCIASGHILSDFGRRLRLVLGWYISVILFDASAKSPRALCLKRLLALPL